MPKVRRENLPRPLFRHLLTRVHERQISSAELEDLLSWLEQEPEVPKGKWFKRFAGVILCGEGELPKTFLLPSQAAFGEEVF